MTTNLRYSLVTIRKTHQCHGCCRLIEAKTPAYSWATAQEGTVCNGYTCTTCDSIIDHYPHDYWDREMDFYFGFVREHIINCDHPDKTPEQFLAMLKEQAITN